MSTQNPMSPEIPNGVTLASLQQRIEILYSIVSRLDKDVHALTRKPWWKVWS